MVKKAFHARALSSHRWTILHWIREKNVVLRHAAGHEVPEPGGQVRREEISVLEVHRVSRHQSTPDRFFSH